ncbi:MAG: TIGR00282 family metallophosphoesterase [Culicoidibacterales bacterium]
MKILFVGDIYANPGREILKRKLKLIQKQNEIDFTIVNGENATNGRGLSLAHYKEMMQLPIDVITMGNHIFGQSEIFDFLDEKEPLIRPENGHPNWPGKGYFIYEHNNKKIAVINLLGSAGVVSSVNPFLSFDQIYEKIKAEADIIFVDFHAEMTSEKIAFGYHATGRAQVVIGTHTHVQTADARILEGQTAYLTDVGMTGPLEGVIGVKKEIIIQRFLKNYPSRFEVAKGKTQLNAVIITIDDQTNLPVDIKTIHVEDA